MTYLLYYIQITFMCYNKLSSGEILNLIDKPQRKINYLIHFLT